MAITTGLCNGIKNDNRWLNIRRASRTENNRNASKPKNNTSGFKGVSFHNPTGKYRAYCTINGKQIHLGLYATHELAYKERTAYAKLHHGQFYRG